jgi:hypothetical protein
MGPGGAMGSADEVNIQASELNRTMKVTSTLHTPLCKCSSTVTCPRRLSISTALHRGKAPRLTPLPELSFRVFI